MPKVFKICIASKSDDDLKDLNAIELEANKGIINDRYYSANNDKDVQLTLIEKENIDSKFDVIIIFEVLEHLNDWQSFIKKIQKNLKKNGTLIISTINRNLISKFLTIDLAENFLEWIPLNTHNYYKFIKPKELGFILHKNNFTNIKFEGLTFNPLSLNWKLTSNTKINFFCSCNNLN